MIIKINEKSAFLMILSLILLANISLFLKDLNIEYLRQFLVLILLTFLPGILILNFFDLRNLNKLEIIIYTIGVSLSFMMFVGFLMNTLYPIFGIKGPISQFYLTITFSIFVLILLGLNFILKNNISLNIKIDSKIFTQPSLYFLVLIPIVSVMGSILNSGFGINYISLLVVLLIAITVIMVVFDFLPKKLFPLTIFVISISLLFQQTLLSFISIGGGDVGHELFLMNLIIEKSVWNPSDFVYLINNMLSIIFIVPIYSIMLNIDLVYIKQILFVFIISIIPLALYEAFGKIFDKKFSFLSVFFFISLPLFTMLLASIVRQAIGEIFFALIILLLLSKNINESLKSTLFVIFTLSIVVSYYGLSYIFFFFIIILFIISYLTMKFNIRNFIPKSHKMNFFSFTLITLYTVFMLSWYMYNSGNSTFEAFIGIFKYALLSINHEYLASSSMDNSLLLATGMVESRQFMWVQLNAFYQRLVIIFIILGVFVSVFKYLKSKFSPELFAMIITSIILLGSYLIIPKFSQDLQISRFYHLMLFTLSTCCILGSETLFKYVSKFLRISLKKNTIYKILLVILIPYFLFNTGLVYDLAGDPSGLVSISKFKNSDDTSKKWTYYSTIVPIQEYYSSFWLSNKMDNQSKIYAGHETESAYLSPYPLNQKYIKLITPDNQSFGDNYVYLSTFNIISNNIEVPPKYKSNDTYFNTSSLTIFTEKNKIYSNGGSEIYK